MRTYFNSGDTAALVVSIALFIAACSDRATDDAETPRNDPPELEQSADPEPEEAPATEADKPADPVAPELRAEAGQNSRGMSWHYKPSWALFGPPESEGVLALRCLSGRKGMVVTRYSGSPLETGMAQPIRFRGEGGSARIDMSASTSELGPAMWEGEVSQGAALAKLFAYDGAPIIATLEGEPPLALPVSGEVAALIQSCAP